MYPSKVAFPFLLLHFFWPTVSTCTVPPAYWCDNAIIAQKCGVLDQCSHYNSSVYKQKIKLQVVYESLCRGCDQFISKTLYNITWLQWDGWQFIDLELIPYGNSHSLVSDDGSYSITCQHGPQECWLNKLHSCVMAVMNDPNLWLPIISCLQGVSANMSPIQAADYCLRKPMVDTRHRHLIWACHNSSYGDDLQRRAADKTDSIMPDQHSRVPWIAVNGVSLRSMQYLSQYGYDEPILYYALRHWFRGGRDPKMNKFGARPRLEDESENDKRKCVGLDNVVGKRN